MAKPLRKSAAAEWDGGDGGDAVFAKPLRKSAVAVKARSAFWRRSRSPHTPKAYGAGFPWKLLAW